MDLIGKIPHFLAMQAHLSVNDIFTQSILEQVCSLKTLKKGRKEGKNVNLLYVSSVQEIFVFLETDCSSQNYFIFINLQDKYTEVLQVL